MDLRRDKETVELLSPAGSNEQFEIDWNRVGGYTVERSGLSAVPESGSPTIILADTRTDLIAALGAN